MLLPERKPTALQAHTGSSASEPENPNMVPSELETGPLEDDADIDLTPEELKKAADDKRLSHENRKVRTKLKAEREENVRLRAELAAKSGASATFDPEEIVKPLRDKVAEVSLENHLLRIVAQSGSPEPDTAMLILRAAAQRGEDGIISFVWTPDGTPAEATLENALKVIPPSLLPARGHSGSGGQGSREVTTRSHLSNAIDSQSAYEANKPAVNAEFQRGLKFR